MSSSRRHGVPWEPELRPETASGEQEAAGADEQESRKRTEPAGAGKQKETIWFFYILIF